MSEYIEREKALDAVVAWAEICPSTAISEIECMTAADVVPVVRGEWEVAIGYDPNKKVQCQNCYKMAHEPTAYCPNCGADMRGESEVKQ